MKLKDLLETNITEYGEYPFLFYKEKTFTNVETKQYADQFASGLQNLGIAKGDRVMVCMPNCPEVLFAYQGITRVGATVVPVMFTLHPKELHYIIRNSGAKAVITSSAVRSNVDKSLDGFPAKPLLIVVDMPSDEQARNFYDVFAPTKAQLDDDGNADDKAVILYTSGTTGN
ncbi:MAG: AMP-binding protein, partial [Bacillus sp. (in: firmicutes)]